MSKIDPKILQRLETLLYNEEIVEVLKEKVLGSVMDATGIATSNFAYPHMRDELSRSDWVYYLSRTMHDLKKTTQSDVTRDFADSVLSQMKDIITDTVTDTFSDVAKARSDPNAARKPARDFVSGETDIEAAISRYF